MSNLFACSRCYSRHPFEELSSGQQLCKNCLPAHSTQTPKACFHCKSEFISKNPSAGSNPICSKCEQNLKTYGKPTNCTICGCNAAFIGGKCSRCVHSEKKYGSPVVCVGCGEPRAFMRGQDASKHYCYTCTINYKKNAHKSDRKSRQRRHLSPPSKRPPNRPDVTKMGNMGHEPAMEPVEKKNRSLEDTIQSSDHVVALTQLREQIAGLTRQLAQKDKELLAKDRQITELKANNFTTESELRNKLKEAQREFQSKYDLMAIKVKQLQKELAIKKKEGKKASLTIVGRNEDSGGDIIGGGGDDDD